VPRGWDPPYDPFGGYKETRSFLGIHRERDISDTEIDKYLEQGKNPRSKFARQIKQMSPRDQRKVGNRIKARETKRNQGKK
jgi:hypothetical protein